MAEDGFNFSMFSRPGTATRSFMAGDIIFRQGDAADELFVIKEGQVMVSRAAQAPSHARLSSLFRSPKSSFFFLSMRRRFSRSR